MDESANSSGGAASGVAGGESSSETARVIKRYANRKLYDTQRSRYVTLDQIAEMIRQGEDVRIIDNNSKEDLTSVTLAQILFEEEKKKKSFLSLNSMRSIIQSGGERIEELVSQAKQSVDQAKHQATLRVDQAKQSVTGVFRKKEDGGPAPAPEGETEIEAESRAVRELREWLENSQRLVDDWRKKLDQRLHSVGKNIMPVSALKREVSELKSRIAELEDRLQRHDDEG